MKKLLVLSGKGGTGKTTVSASFIQFAKAQAFADCDVDAPNLHLVTAHDDPAMEMPYYGSDKAVIDPEKCIGCGACQAHCRFDSIERDGAVYKINEYACEGCGVCTAVCPQGAVSMQPDVAGQMALYLDDAVFATAELKMGRGNSGKLVSQVKQLMTQAAPDADVAIIDGSPGIGCPVIASVSGVDLVLIVAEPSCSGLSDLTRLVKTAGMLQVRACVCVNKSDVSPEMTAEIQAFCRAQGVPFMGCLPYDQEASAAINAGRSIAQTDCPLRTALYDVYEKTMTLLEA